MKPDLTTPAPGRRRPRGGLLTALAVCLLSSAFVLGWLLWPATPTRVAPTPAPVVDSALVERGRVLALQGNCQACHMPRGGPAYAGGVRIDTPYGAVFGSNLTPSPQGLGGWSAEDFWRALHWGESRDGRRLNPAFPYPNFTHLRREDSNALWAYFQSLPPADTPNRPNELAWPYNTQAALKVWQLLYFRPGPAETGGPTKAADNPVALRGAYLVNGLGHCSACHASRDTLAGNGDMLSLHGGLLPVSHWYAPSLHDPAEAGVQDWPLADTVALLRDGRSGPHLSTGPMAEVVHGSLRHWPEADLLAVATHLKGLPRVPVTAAPPSPAPAPAPLRALGAQVYEQHCAQCHGARGQGFALADGQWAYPPLAGNRSITQSQPANALQSVLHGGFGLASAAMPQPFGMPPYVLQLNDTELAAVLSHLRQSWGNAAGAVTPLQVQALRGSLGR